MGFVVGVVAALLVIFLLSYITIKKPVFGRVLIAVSVILIALSTFFYFQLDKRVEKKKTLIPTSEIILGDIVYNYDYGNYFKLTGSIQNLSKRFRLQSILIKISFYQCSAGKNKSKLATKVDDRLCEFIEEKQINIKTRLAKAQSGQFETYILLEKNKYLPLVWKVELVSGVAR